MVSELEEICKTAKLCIELATRMCLEFKHGEDAQSLKSDKTWVTAADKKIENELRKIIQTNHPTHFILGEEEGGSLSTQEDQYTWILDPIDGTFSFVHNVPFYSSLLAVLKGSQPIIGFAALPAMNIVMSAVKGQGAFINQTRYVKPKIVGSSHIELVATADIYRFYMEKKEKVLEFFYQTKVKTRTYGDALAYYLLLNGSIRAFVDPKVEIWDVAPFHVILPEAGFDICTWDKKHKLIKGTSVAYAVDELGSPVNCHDVLNAIAEAGSPRLRG
jgi:histidinol-phosphatase